MRDQLKYKDKRILDSQWLVLTQFWETEDSKRVCSRNKANREKQTITHTAGTKSFARIFAEMKKNDPEHKTPSRAEVFVKTRTNKDGQPCCSEAARSIDAIKTKMDQQVGSSSEIAIDDIYAQVTGPERHGRVRCLGMGPMPTRVFGTSSSQPHYSQEYVRRLENDNKELRQTIGSYESRLIQLEEFVTMQRVRENSVNDNVPPYPPNEPPIPQSSSRVGLNEIEHNTRIIEKKRSEKQVRY